MEDGMFTWDRRCERPLRGAAANALTGYSSGADAQYTPDT
jgi:hypothetical protein